MIGHPAANIIFAADPSWDECRCRPLQLISWCWLLLLCCSQQPPTSSKLILYSLLLIICSLIYYIKTNEQNLKHLETKSGQQLRAKDKRIDELNEKLETMERISDDLNNKKSVINSLNNDLVSIRKQLKKSDETVGNKDKQIEDLLNEIQSRDAENNRLVTRVCNLMLNWYIAGNSIASFALLTLRRL